MRRYCYVLVVFVFLSIPGFSEKRITKGDYLAWAREIAGGLKSICEPILLSEIPSSFSHAKTFVQDWRSQNKGSSFEKVIMFSSICYPPYEIQNCFNTKDIPRKLIQAILNSRKSIRNDLSSFFDGDGKSFLGDGYYFVYFSPNVILGYLEYFQILTIILLLENNDFRFENEAKELLKYIIEPMDVLDNDEAKWHYYSQQNGRCIERLIRFYLRSCSERFNKK